MTGCNSLMTRSDQAKVSESLLFKCGDLPLLDNGNLDTITALLVEIAGQYHQCSAGKKALIDAVKEIEK